MITIEHIRAIDQGIERVSRDYPIENGYEITADLEWVRVYDASTGTLKAEWDVREGEYGDSEEWES